MLKLWNYLLTNSSGVCQETLQITLLVRNNRSANSSRILQIILLFRNNHWVGHTNKCLIVGSSVDVIWQNKLELLWACYILGKHIQLTGEFLFCRGSQLVHLHTELLRTDHGCVCQQILQNGHAFTHTIANKQQLGMASHAIRQCYCLITL